jgi:hypothetical protein
MHRLLVYSRTGGELRGKLSGEGAALTPSRALLLVHTGPGKLGVYDLESLGQRREIVLSSSVSVARFSAAGRRLLVLTADQVGYLFDAQAW